MHIVQKIQSTFSIHTILKVANRKLLFTDEAMTWEFLPAASDDEVTLTIDGEVVYTATPATPSACADIYQQAAGSDCNAG